MKPKEGHTRLKDKLIVRYGCLSMSLVVSMSVCVRSVAQRQTVARSFSDAFRAHLHMSVIPFIEVEVEKYVLRTCCVSDSRQHTQSCIGPRAMTMKGMACLGNANWLRRACPD